MEKTKIIQLIKNNDKNVIYEILDYFDLFQGVNISDIELKIIDDYVLLLNMQYKNNNYIKWYININAIDKNNIINGIKDYKIKNDSEILQFIFYNDNYSNNFIKNYCECKDLNYLINNLYIFSNIYYIVKNISNKTVLIKNAYDIIINCNNKKI